MPLRPDVVKIDPHQPEAEKIRRAAEVVRRGGVIAYPTETVYGLGADAFDPEAVGRVYQIKGRDLGKAILLIAAELQGVEELVEEIPPVARRLMEKFWPGPLTLVFRASARVPKELLGEGRTIGVRIPGSRLCRELVREAGVPLTSTSANRSGQPNPRKADEVLRALGESIDLVLDGGPTPSAVPSTVVEVSSGEARLVRPGAIDWEALRRLIESP